jgi:predicted permease
MTVFGYLEALQVFVVQTAIVAAGYIFARLKYFTTEEIVPFLRIVRIVAVPCLVFREIALSKLEYATYEPFLISLLTQATTHLFSFFAALIIPAPSKFMQFLGFVYGYSYTCFTCYACPTVRVLLGTNFQFIPIVMNIVQTLFMRPLHLFGLYFVPPVGNEQEFKAKGPDAYHKSRQGSDMFTDIRPSVSEHLDGNIVELADIDETNAIDGEIQPPAHVEEEEAAEEEDHTSEPVVPHSRRWTITVAVFASANIAVVLAVIWSAIGWPFPLIVETFFGDFARSVFACQLFAMGVLMYSHPFLGGRWAEVIPFLVIHHFVIPIVAGFWGWTLGVEKTLAKTSMLMFAMPVELTGVYFVNRYGSQKNAVTFTAFWSQIIALPCFMVWVAILNETNIL